MACFGGCSSDGLLAWNQRKQLDHESIGAGSMGYPGAGYFQKSPIGQAARPSLERHAALSDRVI